MRAFSTRFGVSTSPSREGSSPRSARRFLIRSCIVLFYLTALGNPAFAEATAGKPAPEAAAGTLAVTGAAADQADDLYANRADLASARQAADLWRNRLSANPQDFDAAWKLSRAEYWIGSHAPAAEARMHFEAGIEAGQRAVAIDPNRPDGHFWIAANMGTLAESFGIRAGLKYRKSIRQELETVLRIDPGYRQGSADRALGRWYDKVPRLFGGDGKLAEAHLKKALAYNPSSMITHYFLAELYVDQGRKNDARAELQKVLDAPIDPEYVPEDHDWKEKAQKLLRTLG